jgi:DNA-binding FrmR family transcriptional regulator
MDKKKGIYKCIVNAIQNHDFVMTLLFQIAAVKKLLLRITIVLKLQF